MTSEDDISEARRLRRERLDALILRCCNVLWPDRGKPDITRVTNWGTAGKWRVARASLKFGDGSERIAITSGPEGKVRQLVRRQYRAELVSGDVALLEPEGLLVESFPADWKLPGLAQVTDPGQFLRLAVEAGLLTQEEAPLANVTINTRRYLPHKRAVIRYRIEVGNRTSSAIGKVFSSRERAARAFEVMTRLQRRSSSRHLSPRPLLLREDWSFVLMERVVGDELQAIIDADPESAEALDGVKAAARSLAGLHAQSEEEPIGRSWQAETAMLRKIAAQRDDEASRRASALLDVLAGLVWPPAKAVFTHGDFNPRQVLIHDGVARIVDLDRGGPGEAASDIGRFVAALEGRAAVRNAGAYRRLAAAFQAEYELATGVDVVQASAPHEVTALLHRALRLLGQGLPENISIAMGLVETGEERLRSSGLIPSQ